MPSKKPSLNAPAALVKYLAISSYDVAMIEQISQRITKEDLS